MGPLLAVAFLLAALSGTAVPDDRLVTVYNIAFTNRTAFVSADVRTGFDQVAAWHVASSYGKIALRSTVLDVLAPVEQPFTIRPDGKVVWQWLYLLQPYSGPGWGWPAPTGIAVEVSRGGAGPRGLGMPGWIALNGSTGVGAKNHELGHALGLPHAGRWRCSVPPLGGTCVRKEYGHPWAQMGGTTPRDHTPAHKHRLGWLGPEDGSLVVIDAMKALPPASTVTLAPYHARAGARALLLKRPKTGVYDRHFYVEYRTPGAPVPIASPIAPTVVVSWTDGYLAELASGQSIVLDAVRITRAADVSGNAVLMVSTLAKIVLATR